MNPPCFSILYADPPWQFKTRHARKITGSPDGQPTSRSVPYPTMDTEAICSLPIAQITEPNCVLFLWATYPMLPDALKVIAAWGFQYKTTAFTWVKRSRSDRGFHFGLGYWTRANPEVCLLATQGHPHRMNAGVPNLIISPVRDHSRKPDEVRERIVTLCGDLPRAELFARKKVPGWHVWGNEIESDFTLKVHTDSLHESAV